MQLAFSFNSTAKEIFAEEDFLLLPENADAFNLLKKLFGQKTFAKSQLQSLILQGAPASGKSHMLHIFAQKTSAIFLTKDDLIQVDPTFFQADHFYIIENFSEINDDKSLLNLINSAAEAQAFLILSERKKTKFQLQDLNSRLKNIVSAKIENPSQESLKMLLANGASRRQMKLSRQVIDFLSHHLDRNFSTIFSNLSLLETMMQNGEKINLATVKRIVGQKLFSSS